MSHPTGKLDADMAVDLDLDLDLDLDEALAFAVEVAQEAGRMILDGQRRRFASASASEGASHAEKLNSVDLVTEVDRAVEAYVTRAIRERYPSHAFVGEETYDASSMRFGDDAGPTWIVDPIDGTTNFVHGFPFVACSIGLAISGRPVVGVIHAPFLGQTYSAARGRGARLHSPLHPPEGQRLPFTSTQPLRSLGQALVAVEWGSARRAPELLVKSRAYERLAGDPTAGDDGEGAIEGGKMVHSLRSLGSAALNICQVAAGSMDLYWEIGCWAWDVCAGIVILEESGGLAFGAKARTLASIARDQADSAAGLVVADVLQGRKYLFVRAMSDGETESGRQAQLRSVRELYESVEEYEP